MAMRRPRIKPVANIQLNSKRKSKPANDVKTVKVDERAVKAVQEVEPQIIILSTQPSESFRSSECVSEVRVETLSDTTANENNLNNDINNEKGAGFAQEPNAKTESNVRKINEDLTICAIEKYDLINNTKDLTTKNVYGEATERLNDSDAFKCPPKVGYQRSISHTSNCGIDDVFYSDIEENALQMDLENSTSNSSMCPSKNLIRQRIKPTPHFGQRRNSFVGSSPPHTSGNEENHPTNSNAHNDFGQTTQTRRERHHSASFTGNNQSSHHHHTPHKYLPTGVTNTNMGRIRTESGCSVFSDTNTSSYKSRKTEDHKQNPRKDFEARFLNGVPEKSAIKMSDLIYYNPITNPMEQKTNPSVKLEQTETSSNDVKPFTGMQAKDTDADIDAEAVPVPQLKLNAKGELILDDKSLVIETTAEQEARKVLANSSLIYLDENTGMNGFYSRQKRTREWIPSETIKFYRCLQNIGTDFSLMVSLFPNRTRRDLKLKFKKEERKNSHLINKALLYPKQFDIESLKAQISDEEKHQEEQAKKNKATKEKCKESKKRKVSNISIAKRVLIVEDVYQNENGQKTKSTRKTKHNKDKSDDIAENNKKSPDEKEEILKIAHKINTNKDISGDIAQSEEGTISNKNDSVNADKSENVTHNKIEQKMKRKIKNPKKSNNDQVKNGDCDIETSEIPNMKKRRRKQKRTPNKLHNEEIILKGEIKIENKQEYNNQTSNENEYQDTKQLQKEMNELLDSDLETPHNTTYETSTTNLFSVISEVGQCNKHINTPPYPDQNDEIYIEANVNADISNYAFINLDDCTLSVKDDINYINIPPTTNIPSPPARSQSPSSASQLPYLIEYETESLDSTIPEPDVVNNDVGSSLISERELNEDDIQSILRELAEGSLVLVSTLDPDDPDKVLNEIYMMDKNTGDLCEEPLNIPDNIVQCILTVVS